MCAANPPTFHDLLDRLFFPDPERNMVELCITEKFYDFVNTFCQSGTEYPHQHLRDHHTFLDNATLSRNAFGLMSATQLENALKQDHFQQQPYLQTSLRLVKHCRNHFTGGTEEQMHFESLIFLAPYFNLVQYVPKHIALKYCAVARFIVTFVLDLMWLHDPKSSTFETLYAPAAKGTPNALTLACTEDPIVMLFVLHMHGFDRLLRYQVPIEKFAEKITAIKQHKIYQLVWKNKEVLELMGMLMNANITEGLKTSMPQPNHA